jgi:predicted RNase H-like HicB family nuclease
MKVTGVIQLEEDRYVAHCPELGVVSQGDSQEEARANLEEACRLFLEYACEEEIHGRLRAAQVVEFEVGGGEAADGET